MVPLEVPARVRVRARVGVRVRVRVGVRVRFRVRVGVRARVGVRVGEPVLLLPLALCGGRTLLRCEEQGEGVRRVEHEAVVLVAMVRR